MTTLIRIDLLSGDYDSALLLQNDLVERVLDDPSAAYLIFTEHDPPVITLGRRGGLQDILATPDQLASRGVCVRTIPRGGQTTCHSPGQLVAYAIVHLDQQRRSVHAHVANLEQAVVDTLTTYGLDAQRHEGEVGVWVRDAKIAYIGVAVRRWVSFHGVAINVCNDLSDFGLIVPCGREKTKVTSLSRLLGREVDVAEVSDRFTQSFCEITGLHEGMTLAGEDDAL
ncbi:MAG: lipoyl(octanoyl) transferase LipB [Planctomycetota bacterium]|jgi:lipoate-protein ligase B